jgi:translation elongation factor P/translation initiation factor 5A
MYKKYIIIGLVLATSISCKESDEVKGNENNISNTTEAENIDDLASEKTEINTFSSLIGEWVYSYQAQSNIVIQLLNIQKDGEFISVNYSVTSLATLSSKEYDFLGNYKNGMILLDDERFSDIKYSEKQNVIYFEGNIFTKKAVEKALEVESEVVPKPVVEKKSIEYKEIDEDKIVSVRFKITEDNLRLRQSPDLNAAKITNLPIDETVLYLNEKSNQEVDVEIGNKTIKNYWYKVQTDEGEIGWIHGCCFVKQ